MLQDKDLISIQQARERVEKAQQAFQQFRSFSQQQVDQIVAAMASAGRKNARRLAELAVEETGYGKVRDKTLKNLFCSVEVYQYIKDLKTCGVISENPAKKVIDIAVPVGVIAAIIPTTNPTSTAIFKILCALKGRNAIVLSPHPNAVQCTVETARILSEAAKQAGAPDGCIGWLEVASMEGAGELMRNRKTSLILATGGPGLVRAAYSSGKPAFGVGPGNVPAFIEKTANVSKAVRDVLTGKTFDNGVLCSSEQSLICDRSIEAQVLQELEKNRAFMVKGEELEKLCRLVQRPDGKLNVDIVGKDPQVLARMAGFSIPPEAVCLVGRQEGVGPDYPLSREKLSPVLAFYVADGWEKGCERCIEILNYGGLGHTMSLHSNDQNVILEFGLQKPAYRVCVNTPATLGAVGLTTGVPPSMTLGCGTPGGNITSDNITPMHLINIRRVAFETRPFESISYPETGAESARPASSVSGESVRQVVRGVVEEFLKEKKKSEVTGAPAVASNFHRVVDSPPSMPPSAPPERPQEPALDFVCEEDVRLAIRNNQKLVIHEKTIITPSARDLADSKSIFIMGQS